MAHPLPLRDVYAALRQLLGEKASSAETLDFAAHVIRFCLVKRASERRQYLREPSYREQVVFETLPIDLAMEDGGWRIMQYEIDQVSPDSEVARVHIYQVAATCMERRYAVRREMADAESIPLSMTLDWLSTPRVMSTNRPGEIGFDDYSGRDREGYDYED